MDSVPGKGIFEPKTPAKIESISNKPKKKYTEEFKDSNIHGSKHDKRSQEDFDDKDKSGIKLRDDPVFTAAVTPPGCSRKSPRVFKKLRASSNIWNFSRPLVEFNDKKWDTSMPQTPEITHTKQRIQGRESELCKDGVLKGVGMMEKVNFINKLNCKDNGLKVYYRKKKGLKVYYRKKKGLKQKSNCYLMGKVVSIQFSNRDAYFESTAKTEDDKLISGEHMNFLEKLNSKGTQESVGEGQGVEILP